MPALQHNLEAKQKWFTLALLTLSPPVVTYRFYCLTPDDFTRQRETLGGERVKIDVVNSDVVVSRKLAPKMFSRTEFFFK